MGANEMPKLSDLPELHPDPAKRVEAAKWWGATCGKWLHPISDNPYPELPGSYVLHAAWDYGWNNWEDVYADRRERDREMIAEEIRQGRPVFQPVATLRE